MKKNRGALKSRNLYKKIDRAQKAAFVSCVVGLAGVVTTIAGAFVVLDKNEDFLKEVATSPAYTQYVLHETTKYNQQLEEGEISSTQYNDYINKIDAGSFLDSEFVTAEQRAVKEYNDRYSLNFGIVAGTLCSAGFLGAAGSLLASGILKCKAGNKRDEEVEEFLSFDQN